MLGNSIALPQWSGGLAPGHIRSGGTLRIGGVDAQELATIYGTPLLALDYGVFDAAIAAFVEAAAPHGIEIAYAGKALLLVEIARHIKHTALSLDVCSIGELAAAQRAGFPPERIFFHGCGKTADELEAIARGAAAITVVDNLHELRQLAARAGPAPVTVILRINTGIEAHTHEFVRTAGERTKFGFDPNSLTEAVALLRDSPNLIFEGLHAHIGSQIYDDDPFVENARALMERAGDFAEAGLASNRIIVGGGFGVAMRPGESDVDLAVTLDRITAAVRGESARRNLPVPRIGIEPGRALIAHAGTSLYTVLATKSEFGKPFAVVDGGIHENPRPALYDAYHHAYAVRPSNSLVETVVCGRSCENDRLGYAKLPSNLQPGELLAMCTTGAYTYSMASNYNRFSRPAVVALRSGTHKLIAQRETLEDLLSHDCDL